MAVGMFMRWARVTKEQYDRARALAPLDRDAAPGNLFHVAAVGAEGICVTDVWESAEDWTAYLHERLLPAFAQLDLAGRPEVEIVDIHALITPGFARL